MEQFHAIRYFRSLSILYCCISFNLVYVSSIYCTSSETQGQIVGRLGRKVFCPIRSEYSFGRLELVRKEFVPRGSYFSFVLLLVEFFPACFDFRLRPHYLPLGLRGCILYISFCLSLPASISFRYLPSSVIS